MQAVCTVKVTVRLAGSCRMMGGVDGQLEQWVGFAGVLSFPALWNDCIKKCSYGVNREGCLRGLRRVIVFFLWDRTNEIPTIFTAHYSTQRHYGSHILRFFPLLLQCKKPHAAVRTLVLLMMGIMMPETCWDRSLITNIRLVASCWFLSLHLSLFYFDFKCRKCPSARRASSTNAIDSDTDIFIGSSVSVNMMNWYHILLIHTFINCINF